jgi:hypothetical protein
MAGPGLVNCLVMKISFQNLDQDKMNLFAIGLDLIFGLENASHRSDIYTEYFAFGCGD